MIVTLGCKYVDKIDSDDSKRIAAVHLPIADKLAALKRVTSQMEALTLKFQTLLVCFFFDEEEEEEVELLVLPFCKDANLATRSIRLPN